MANSMYGKWKVLLVNANDCRCHCFVVHDGRLILFLMQCSQQEIIFHLPIHFMVSLAPSTIQPYHFQLRRQPPPPTCARPGCQLTESLLHCTRKQSLKPPQRPLLPAPVPSTGPDRLPPPCYYRGQRVGGGTSTGEV